MILKPNKSESNDYKRAFSGLQIPLMMAAGPLLGYFIGYGLDLFFHTKFLNWVFLILIIYPTIVIIGRIIKETSEE